MTIAERPYRDKADRTGQPEADRLHEDAYLSVDYLNRPDSAGSSWRHIFRDWVLIAVILLSSSASFGLGLLAGKEEAGKGDDDTLWIENLPPEQRVSAASTSPSTQKVEAPAVKAVPVQPAAAAVPMSGAYVASKSGSKYYLPWCGTVSRIKEENKVWFATKEEAQKAGYEPASNCKGL